MIAEPAHVEWMPGRIGDRPGHRLMVILAAPGCAWARESGGCTNCSFAQSLGTARPVGAEEFRAQLETALEAIPSGASGPIQIDLFVSGSFFNPAEVPPEAQASLLERAAAAPGVERILVETRPEYVDARVLRDARQAAGGVSLEIAIGLESADDDIRERRIHKGFTWGQFEAAARCVAGTGAALRVYVLVKPIDTSEAEAIEDAVRSAERVFSLGSELGAATCVALEPCFVAPGSRLAEDFDAGRYRPPWLWSVVEVVQRVAPLGLVQVGLSDEGLHPAQIARNCAGCSSDVRKALARFNASQTTAVFLGLDCGCRSAWERAIVVQ